MGPTDWPRKGHATTAIPASGANPLLAVAAGTGDVLMCRLREGRANTARGAAHFLRETVRRVRYGGASGQLTVRPTAASTPIAWYPSAARGLRFSITVRQHKSLHNLIEAIPEDAWTPIPYWMDGAADVAETAYTPFQGEPDAAPVRLIVRRVKPTPGSQLALFATYSYHGFITDRDGSEIPRAHPREQGPGITVAHLLDDAEARESQRAIPACRRFRVLSDGRSAMPEDFTEPEIALLEQFIDSVDDHWLKARIPESKALPTSCGSAALLETRSSPWTTIGCRRRLQSYSAERRNMGSRGDGLLEESHQPFHDAQGGSR